MIGINHSHINGQVNAVLRGGGELVSFYAVEDDLAAGVHEDVPAGEARAARRRRSSTIHRFSWSSVPRFPISARPIGIRVMQHGKDYMADKPGITTLEQLAEVRTVQAQTKRIYSIMYSERFENRATVKAGELVKAGAIGRVIQTIGLGPHRINPPDRPEWFWDKPRYGGILCDIGSHQADQFLYFTGSTRGEVVASQVANVHHPEHPTFEDFGDVTLRGDKGTGYIRVDWFTPERPGDLGRRPADRCSARTDSSRFARTSTSPASPARATCSSSIRRKRDTSTAKMWRCRTARRSSSDVLNRTETAMPQEHCFLATELMLKAQKQAQRVDLT